MNHKTEIMDQDAMKRALTRISHEIIEKHRGIDNIVLIGIQRRGVPIARRIADCIFQVEKKDVPIGQLDITFYRDDLSLLNEHPVVNGTDVAFNIHDKEIVLIDDVLFTGRTVRAAMEAIMDMGRPRSIFVAVLTDRGHRELPIKADFVGKNVPTSRNEIIHVNISEIDHLDSVTLGQLR